MAVPSASTSAHHLKRQSLDTYPAGSNGPVLRSRPSSPIPGSPRSAGYGIDGGFGAQDALPLQREPFAQISNGRANGAGLRSDPSFRRETAKHAHPLASALSSGQHTPNEYAFISDERAPLLVNEAEQLSNPVNLQREWQRIPQYHDAEPDMPTFLSTERGGFIRPPTLRSRLELLRVQIIANLISTSFLLLIVLWALASRALRYISLTVRGKHKSRLPRLWDKPERWQNEKLVKDVKYYARSCGYDIEDQTVVTKDGYELRVHKVIVPSQRGKVGSDGRGGFPVIIQHGLFQSSGSFVTSEERSLAFWLAEKGGYQVYLGVCARWCFSLHAVIAVG